MGQNRKVYRAHLGFYDTVVAAQSQKSALAAWGSRQDLFHLGLAKPTTDSDAVKAAMAKPGVVLKRPVGSSIPFSENPPLPDFPGSGQTRRSSTSSREAKAKSSRSKNKPRAP